MTIIGKSKRSKCAENAGTNRVNENNYILQKAMDAITYPCVNLRYITDIYARVSNYLVKAAPNMLWCIQYHIFAVFS